MRQSRSSGSGEGVMGNHYSYSNSCCAQNSALNARGRYPRMTRGLTRPEQDAEFRS
jgi:hypothetical protein